MDPRHFDRKKLEQLLAGTGEPEAPPWLAARIMAAIDDRRPSFSERIRDWWLGRQSVSFSPAWLSLTVALAISAFWLGTLIERRGQPDLAGEAGIEQPALTDNAEANYLIGRGLLAAGQDDRALTFFSQAVRQAPGVAEFAHWQGVAYWALGELNQERQSYLSSMREQPDYLPSLLNLGHNYLAGGQYRQALMQYENVLRVDPREASALYNRALIHYLEKDSGQAERGFIEYLEHHRTGKWVFRATRHLHQLGNFTFRSYRIGASQVVLNMAALLSPDGPVRQQEVMHLADAVTRAAGGSELHLVVYNQGDKSAAKATAVALQRQLMQYQDVERTVAVRVSWFDVAERFSDANGSEQELATGLLIFTRPVEESNRRNSI